MPDIEALTRAAQIGAIALSVLSGGVAAIVTIYAVTGLVHKKRAEAVRHTAQPETPLVVPSVEIGNFHIYKWKESSKAASIENLSMPLKIQKRKNSTGDAHLETSSG